MNNLEEIIADSYLQHANEVRAGEMSAYMRNLFPFYGISKPARSALDKPLLQELKHETPDMKLIHSLWNKPQREYQYFCLEYLIAAKKYWPENLIDELEKLIVNKSWWDSVDTIAVKLVGEYFKKWPQNQEKYITRWTSSDNMWLNRTAILFQLKYKDKTDAELLYNIIRKHVHSNEFFIQKAIGWALRERAYTDSRSVIDFVNSTALKALSRREALKKIIIPDTL